jgi:hypothetical protein
MHVRKAEIVLWIDQGWLEATNEGQGRTVAYLISPEALQRCLREQLQDLQKRNIRSSTILAVFNQFCYVPKHTVGEQLLQVREAKREQAAYESNNPFRKWRSVMRQSRSGICLKRTLTPSAPEDSAVDSRT